MPRLISQTGTKFKFEVEQTNLVKKDFTKADLDARKAKLVKQIVDLSGSLTKKQTELEEVNSLLNLINNGSNP